MSKSNDKYPYEKLLGNDSVSKFKSHNYEVDNQNNQKESGIINSVSNYK